MTEGAQRRLAAIFVADGVEFARCAEADEPGTLARLQTDYQEIRRAYF
jgi:class 3 adenylate cyclase